MTTDETISGWFFVVADSRATFIEAASIIGIVETDVERCRLLLIGGHTVESVSGTPQGIMAAIKRCRGPQSISG